MNAKRGLCLLAVVLLLFSALILSGCTTEPEGVVGVPEGEDARGDYFSDESRVVVYIPILNTYNEPKEIVVEFQVFTEEENHYSETKVIRAPERSDEEYSKEIFIPEEETAVDFKAEIIVSEDEVKIIETEGESSDEEAFVNVTIVNTNFDPKKVVVEFQVVTEYGGVESEIVHITLAENSMDEYSQKLYIDATPKEYHAEIIG